MNLYESISSKINEKKDLITIIKDCEEEYQTQKKYAEDIYSQIVELCPMINEDNNSDVLDFLEYLCTYVMMDNIDPTEAIETVLIEKGYKENTKDFDKLMELVHLLIIDNC